MALVAGEIALQSLRGNIAGDALRVDADARAFDGFVVEVGAENLHVAVALCPFQTFAHENRKREDLLAACAARHPEAIPGN